MLTRIRNSFFFKHVKIQKKKITITASILISQAFLGIIIPIPLKFVLDYVLGKKANAKPHPYLEDIVGGWEPIQMLAFGVGLYALFYITALLLDVVEIYYMTKTSNSLIESARKDIAKSVLSSKKNYIDMRRKADIVGRLSQDTFNIQVLFQTGLPVMVRAIPSLIMVLVVTLSYDWKIFMFMLGIVALMAWISYYFTNVIRGHRKESRREATRFEQSALQAMNGFMLVRLLDQSLPMRQIMARYARTFSNGILKAHISEGYLQASMTMIKIGLRILIVAIGGYFVLNGKFTIGSIILFTSYVDNVAGAMKDFIKFSYKSARSMASLDRIDELINEANENQDPLGTQYMIMAENPVVEFKNATFSYGQINTVNNFTARLEGGDVAAIRGPSGIGKSTLLNMVSRIVSPYEGIIKINNSDVKDIKSSFLRQYVTYVPQEFFFIKGSIKENLELSVKRELTENEVWAALDMVNASEFIMNLPDTIHTQIGEGGRHLSVGQSRRISLARAFVRAPFGIFLFDEATAGLDDESKEIVLNSIRSLGDLGCMVIYATHDDEELVIANKVIVMNSNGTQELLFNTFVPQAEYKAKSSVGIFS